MQLAMSAVATGTSCSEKHSKAGSTQPADHSENLLSERNVIPKMSGLL